MRRHRESQTGPWDLGGWVKMISSHTMLLHAVHASRPRPAINGAGFYVKEATPTPHEAEPARHCITDSPVRVPSNPRRKDKTGECVRALEQCIVRWWLI